MMGLKERAFAPLSAVSLEELVPPPCFLFLIKEKLLSLRMDFEEVTTNSASEPSSGPFVLKGPHH